MAISLAKLNALIAAIANRADEDGGINAQVAFGDPTEQAIPLDSFPSSTPDDPLTRGLGMVVSEGMWAFTAGLGDFLTDEGIISDAIYASTTILSASNFSSAEFNVFDEDSYLAFVEDTNWEHNATPSGIVFTQSNGQFKVSKAGTYSITIALLLSSSSSTTVVLRLKHNTVTVWTAIVAIYALADPTEFTIPLMRVAAAEDVFELTIDSETASTLEVNPGTTFNILGVA